jgi:hypothetical protein
MPFDQRIYNAEYYARNRMSEIARVVERQRATVAWLRDLRRVPCMDCGGVFPPHVRDFDHRDPATKSFGLASENVYLKSRQVLAAEVAKCDVVCANCHRIRTAAALEGTVPKYGFRRSSVPPATPEVARRRDAWRRRRREQMDLLIRLRQMPCMSCQGMFPVCAMEFDHRQGTQKSGLVSQMAGRVTIRKLLEEIAKCDIVCTNCHRDRSFRRRSANAGVAQLVRAAAFQAAGRGFETRLPLQAQSDLQLRLIQEQRVLYRVA